MKFPNRIKEVCLIKNISQKEFARKMKISRATASAIFNGHRTFSWKTMNKASDVLSTPIQYLFFISDARNS